MIRTRLTERFGLDHPIVSAPMALVSGGRLAAAVSNAGGLGLIGGGYAGMLGGEPDLGAEFAAAGNARVGVGFIVWALDRAPSLLDEALMHRPRCLFLSFGDARPFARKAEDAGVPVICQVQTLAQAEEALDLGAAAVVAQGTEAGGHGGQRATLPFVPEVADLVARRAPGTLVLAAGGIGDGRGLAAALMLGADGAVVGSRFWASREALTPDAMVARAQGASGDDTVRTTAVDALRGVDWPAQYSYRMLKNRLTEEWAGRESEARAAFGSLRAAYDKARAEGDLDTVAVVVGEVAGLIADRPPAAAVLARMVEEAEAAMQDGAARIV
ncbi:NAD(P)H-dependent flavin oxidoreductase [Futiania mangrovi]|uniref:Nitronate monooxygenase n=1 Tax=Futiania mangrovi TaxID=2959716 RepID=A0A9J6PKF5_9PROT|nr:nitronate monooxygenase [Futiania mangrovii]MCP1336554.1 nitronate monooxygenase [Futiania mangrovii]